MNNKTSTVLININFNVRDDVLPKLNCLSEHVSGLTHRDMGSFTFSMPAVFHLFSL